MPASAAMTISAPSIPWRAWNWRTIGTIVRVSALLPSKQPISSGYGDHGHARTNARSRE